MDGTTILMILPFKVTAGDITINPTSGAVGSQINISGSYFGSTESITVLYDSSPINIAGDKDTDSSGAFGVTTITVPEGPAGEHSIIVRGINSGITVEKKFTVKPELTLAPTSGAKGAMITVSGRGFAANSDITTAFGGQTMTPVRSDINGSFTITFAAPVLAPDNYIITATDSAGNSDGDTFTITSSGISLTPTGGNAGTEVTVSGAGFIINRSLNVTFNNSRVATATTDAEGNFSASFNVPALAVGSYKVVASDGINTSEAEFKITISFDINPKTTLASPGYVGAEVTITGAGATPAAAVTISLDGKQIATTQVQADKSFTATFKIPAVSAGEHTITVTEGANTKQFSFFMEVTPPAIPAPLIPEMDAKARGLAFFDWENVTDPSGVTYTLQVSTDKDFSESSILLEKTGLVASEYTLTKDERLKATTKDAPYYWRVRATDGAGNQGEWSGAGSFYTGISFSLPQPVIYLLIGIGALALAVFAFWLGRRTAYY